MNNRVHYVYSIYFILFRRKVAKFLHNCSAIVLLYFILLQMGERFNRKYDIVTSVLFVRYCIICSWFHSVQ